MTVVVVGFVAGAAFTSVALVVFSKFMDKHPPLASRWVIRGKEVEVYEVVLNRVCVYEDGWFPNHYPLRYFMAAAKPVEEMKS